MCQRDKPWQTSLLLLCVFLAPFMSNCYIYVEDDGYPHDDQHPRVLEFIGAAFGTYPYGQTLKGNLGIPPNDSSACSRINTKTYYDFLIVDEDKCTVVTKAHWAELSKAKVLILISEHEIFHMSDEPIIPYDGAGRHITIPTLQVGRLSGLLILRYLQGKDENYRMPISIRFPQLKEKQVATIDYWFTSIQIQSYLFIETLRQIYPLVQNFIEFKPRIALSYHQEAKNLNWTTVHDKCYSSGRYCSPEADGHHIGGYQGHEVIRLDLYSHCVHQSDQGEWFRYMDNMKTTCLKDGHGVHANLTGCARDRIRGSELLRLDQIDHCFEQSFEGTNPDTDDNSVLRGQMEQFTKMRIHRWPEVFLNDRPMFGDLSNDTQVLTQICNSITSTPDECVKYKYQQSYAQKHSTWLIISILFGGIAFIIVLLLIFRKFLRTSYERQFTEQIKEQTHQYITMKEEPAP